MELCIYCHKPMLSDEAYSLRRMGNKTVYWHYLCYTKNSIELIPIDTKSKNELIGFLLKSFPDPDGWVLGILRILGYGLEVSSGE